MELEKLKSISVDICDKVIAIEKFLKKDEINKKWVEDTLKEIDTLADNVYEIYEETCGLEEEHEELQEENKYLEEENETLKMLLFELAQNNLQLQYDLKFKYNIDY